MLPLVVSTYLLVSLLLPPRAHTTTTTTTTGTTTGAGTTTTSNINPVKTPLLALNFPDPCLLHDPSSSTWYAFATGSWTPLNYSSSSSSSSSSTNISTPTWRNIQAARAPSPSGPWTYLPSADPLPSPGAWTLFPAPAPAPQTWAPSVVRLNDTAYVLYYAAQLAGNSSALHCVGAATATTVLGPYSPLPTPVVCPTQGGGAIDPAGFLDPGTGKRYLLYKVDGNAVGEGGECNNGVEPIRKTPIMLQEVDGRDGMGMVGDAVQVLDRDVNGGDGPLVEAPELVFVNGTAGGGGRGGGKYVLFYSNHCWDGPLYSVNYAVAENITGPYVRQKNGWPLIGTGDVFNITAPGGAASEPGGGYMLFHGDCLEGRCLFGAEMRVNGSTVIVS